MIAFSPELLRWAGARVRIVHLELEPESMLWM